MKYSWTFTELSAFAYIYNIKLYSNYVFHMKKTKINVKILRINAKRSAFGVNLELVNMLKMVSQLWIWICLLSDLTFFTWVW